MASRKRLLSTLSLVAISFSNSLAPSIATAQSNETCAIIESLPNLAAFNSNPTVRAILANPANPCYAIAQAKLSELRQAALQQSLNVATSLSSDMGGYSGL